MLMQTDLSYNQEKGQIDWRGWQPKRGEVILVNFGEDGLGSEQKNLRPAVVVSNNMNNTYSSIIQVAPLTSSHNKTQLPVHVYLGIEDGIKEKSICCLEQTRSICKSRAFFNQKPIRITKLSLKKMQEIDRAIKIQFGLF